MKRNTLLLWIILINCLGLHAQRTSLNMHLPDVDLGCIDDLSDVPRPDARSVKSESNCEAGVVDIKHIDDFVISQNCSSKLYRIYQAKDGCGLQVRDTQMYSFVLDTLRPMQKIEIDLGCNPDLDKVIPDPKKLDLGDCLKDFKWLGDERDDRKCRKTLIRTYEIYSCRNKYALVYCYQWIEDLEAPEIQCPDNVHFGCDYSGVPPADPGLVKASDNCCVDSVWWGGDIIISAFDTCEHTLLRRYWAVDCCGNLSYCDQVFNWYSFPNDPVIISCPLGADLGCNIDPSTDIPPATPELVIVDEMCGDYQVTSSLSDITVFNCTYSITRTYSVVDECGNTSHCFQTFTWQVDTEGPTLIACPADLDLGCNPDAQDFDLVSPDFGIEAEDNCGIASIERVKITAVEKRGCEHFYYIHYEVKDHCGNAAYCKQRVFWKEDLIPPTITCPADMDLGCNPAAIPAPDPSLVKAEDNCCLLEVIWLLDVIVENPNGCKQQRIRKYQAIDCCGNTSICEQHIFWTSDVEAPVITACPAGWDLGCNIDLAAELPPADPTAVVAEDNCSEVTIEAHLSDITIIGCQYSISWVYVTTDACGNQSQCLQVFTWTVDTEAPVIDKCPTTHDLGCNPDSKDFDLVSPDYGIEASDNCGISDIKRIGTSEVKKGERCERYYLITYEVSDHCGNTAQCTQKIVWKEDLLPPMIKCPPDLDLGCNPEEIPAPDPGLVKAEDNCCLESVDMTASSIFTENGFFRITRTYTATDCCGNKTSCDQTIIWREQQDVSFYVACPEDVDFGCVRVDPEIPDPIADTPYGGEECPSLFTHAGDNLVQVTPCEYELTRTYFFISCCGDTTPCFQTFQWQWVNTDTVIPVPADQVSICVVPPLPDFVGTLCGPGVPIFAGQNIVGDCTDGNCIVQRFWNSKGCQGSLFISDMQTIEVVCQLAPLGQLEDEIDREVNDFTLYPNPATEVLHLDFFEAIQIDRITIIDLQGRMVKQLHPGTEMMNGHTVSISDLVSGMYQIVVEGSTSITKRFAKM